MSKNEDLGVKLRTLPEAYSAFDEFKEESEVQSFRLGYIPSLTNKFSASIEQLVTVFFRVCNPEGKSPFLSFLLYRTSLDELELPYISLNESTTDREETSHKLLDYARKKAGIMYSNMLGLVGTGKKRFILSEVLNNNVPFDPKLRMSFYWLTSSELAQESVMGFRLCDNVKRFIEEATGACRLFRNNEIVYGPRVGYLAYRPREDKEVQMDSYHRVLLKDSFHMTDFELAQLNCFFGSSPLYQDNVVKRRRIRNNACLLRVILPSDVTVRPCFLEADEQETVEFCSFSLENQNTEQIYVMSVHVVEHTSPDGDLYGFIKSKKQFFLS
jgi:hypothetical protein